ncbi:hypothetical protein DV096_13270 [Bradymonadaceae bacterium TMQ3]|nr:hypothetical protein DV096_13270 [Bradymonadaceae bacterium TMQ3]
MSDTGVEGDASVDAGDSGTGDSGTDADTGDSGTDADSGDNGGGNDSILPCAETTCLHYSLGGDQGLEELYYVDLANPGQAIRIDDASKTEPIMERTNAFTSDATAMVYAREEGESNVLYRVDLDTLQNERVIDANFPGGQIFTTEGSERLRISVRRTRTSSTPNSFLPVSPVSYEPLAPDMEGIGYSDGTIVTADGQTSVVEVYEDGVKSLYKRAFDGSTALEQLTLDGELYRWSLDRQGRRIALIVEKNGVRTLEVGSLDTWTERETLTFDSGIGGLESFVWGPGGDDLVFITYEPATSTAYINWRDIETDEVIAHNFSLGQGSAGCFSQFSNALHGLGTITMHEPHHRDVLLCYKSLTIYDRETYLIHRDNPTTGHKIADQIAGRYYGEPDGFVALQSDSIYFTGNHPSTDQKAIFRTDLETPAMAEVALTLPGSELLLDSAVSPNGEWLTMTTTTGSGADRVTDLYVVRFDALDSPIALVTDYRGEISMKFVEVF